MGYITDRHRWGFEMPMTTRPCFSSGSNGNARPRKTARLKAIDGCEMHCYNIVARRLVLPALGRVRMSQLVNGAVCCSQ